MYIVRSVSSIADCIINWKKNNFVIGFVPTMGMIHEGHISLMKKAKEACDVVVVSIYVNPTQFGVSEDFNTYPRDEESDIEKIKSADCCDLIFMPSSEDMYPSGLYSTEFYMKFIMDIMCAKYRTQHFRGVANVVVKLCNIVKSDIAFFGEKDWQQFVLVKHLLADLHIDTKVIAGDTVRDDSGLALSSRNVKFSVDELSIARLMNVFMKREINAIVSSGKSISKACEDVKDAMLSSGFASVNYVEIRDEDRLELVEDKIDCNSNARMFAAAVVGDVRINDNHRIIVPS